MKRFFCRQPATTNKSCQTWTLKPAYLSYLLSHFTHIYMHEVSHTHTCTRTHTRTRTHTCTHTQKQTHTQTHIYAQTNWQNFLSQETPFDRHTFASGESLKKMNILWWKRRTTCYELWLTVHQHNQILYSQWVRQNGTKLTRRRKPTSLPSWVVCCFASSSCSKAGLSNSLTSFVIIQ